MDCGLIWCGDARRFAAQIPRRCTCRGQANLITLRARDILKQMRNAALDASIFVERMEKAEFLVDKRTQQAVIMSLVIIGEAATKIMDRHADVAQAHHNISWRSMRGMRNRIAHGYSEIKLNLVWETVRVELPQLDQILLG